LRLDYRVQAAHFDPEMMPYASSPSRNTDAMAPLGNVPDLSGYSISIRARHRQLSSDTPFRHPNRGADYVGKRCAHSFANASHDLHWSDPQGPRRGPTQTWSDPQGPHAAAESGRLAVESPEGLRQLVTRLRSEAAAPPTTAPGG